MLWSYTDRLAAALDLRLPARTRSGGGRPATAAPVLRPRTAAASPTSSGALADAGAGGLVSSGSVFRDREWDHGRRVPAAAPRRGCDACSTRPMHAATGPACSGGRVEVGWHGNGRGGGADGSPECEPGRGDLPAPLDARGLAQVLRAVKAVESYLCCTGRVLHFPEAVCDNVDGDDSGAGLACISPTCARRRRSCAISEECREVLHA